MRSCDGCTACCKGYLEGFIFNHKMGGMIPCNQLVNETCKVYDDRPQMCRNYYCAWAQELLPMSLKPSEIGVVVSVEVDRDGRQYLKAVSPTANLDEKVVQEINNFVTQHNTYFVHYRVIPIKEE